MVHQWASRASCPPVFPLSSPSEPSSLAPLDKMETEQAMGVGPGWVSCSHLCNHHQTAAFLGDSVFSQQYLSFTQKIRIEYLLCAGDTTGNKTGKSILMGCSFVTWKAELLPPG